MSTTTNTTTTSASSAASSTKFGIFAMTFGISASLAYLVCLFWNLPLFTFHPATNRIALGWEGPISGQGPVMYWYGWTCTSIIAAVIVGLITTMLPEHIGRKIPLFLVWLIPILCIPLFAYSLMPAWTHP